MTAIRMSWLAVPALNTLFQFFIKRGAAHLGAEQAGGSGLLSDAASRWILAAIIVEIACFFLWMDVLGKLDLSKAFPLSAVSYLLIMATGWFVFDEPATVLQVVGSGLILVGVWFIAAAGSKAAARTVSSSAVESCDVTAD